MARIDGEVTGIHRKIDELSSTMQRQVRTVGDEVSYMRGTLDATLPELARTTQVQSMILDHKNGCRKSIMPKKNNDELIRLLKKIAVGLTVLGAAIYALVRVMSGEVPELPAVEKEPVVQTDVTLAQPQQQQSKPDDYNGDKESQ